MSTAYSEVQLSVSSSLRESRTMIPPNQRSTMKKYAALVLTAVFSVNSFALLVFLRSESVSEGNRYCKYSDGYILTIDRLELCPLSIDR